MRHATPNSTLIWDRFVRALQSRQVKSICGMRDALVSSRTQLINNLRGWLRGQGNRIRSGWSASFTQRAREIDKLPDYVESQLVAIDALSTEIAKADRHIQACAEANPVCIRLMTVPGVGPQIALRFVATADEIGRFRDAHRLESYFGLVPGEKSSSDMQQRLSITKWAPPRCAGCWSRAAWSVRVRCGSEHARPLQCWALEIEKRRGKRIATVALARKLAGILFSIWRDGTTYDCTRVSTMR